MCHVIQPATAGMLPPSDSDEDEGSEENNEEEAPVTKTKAPRPAVESTKP